MNSYIAISPTDLADESDFGIGQFGAMVTFPLRIASHVVHMLLVLLMCQPFNIVGSIIRRIGVFVVHLMSGGWRTEEGKRDDPVKQIFLCDVVLAERYAAAIADCVYRLQNVARSAAASLVDALDSPKVADFVESFVANNGTPFFDRLSLHRNLPFGATQRDAHTSPLLSF